MGARRPSCEECGKVELCENNQFVWYAVNEFPLLEATPGGYRINMEMVRILCREYYIEPVSEFVKRVNLVGFYLTGAGDGEGDKVQANSRGSRK